MSLRARIISAGTWVMGGHFASQFLRLATNLLMTRLLVPEMFGVMAVANVLMVGIQMLSDFGLQQNIVQSKSSDRSSFQNTAWTVQIIRGFVLGALTVLFTMLLTSQTIRDLLPENSVYANSILASVLLVLAFNPVIRGFESTKTAMSQRKMHLSLVVKLEFISQLTGIIVMIGWALISRSIWALVVGSLFTNCTKVFLSHKLLPGIKNRLHINRPDFLEIFNFGKWIFVTSILGFLTISADRLILGWLVSPDILGLYAVAYFIVLSVTQGINKIVSSIGLPALSEIVREREHELMHYYYKFRFPIDAISLFLAGGLIASGPIIIELLYDDRYIEAGSMLQALGGLLIMERYSVTYQSFISLGHPRVLTPIIILRLLGLFALTPLAFNSFGIDGAVWAIVLSSFIPLPVILFIKSKFERLSFKKELIVLPILLLGCLVGTICNLIMEKIL